jgi:hypothetical protein
VNGDRRTVGFEPLAAAHEAAAPSRLLAAARRVESGPAPDPRRGDLWRVTWAESTALVVAIRILDDAVEAAPLTIEPDVGDDQSLCLSPDETVLDASCAVWAGLSQRLPLRIFDAYLGQIASDAVSAVMELVSGEVPRSGHQLGDEITSIFDPIATDRAELEDLMDELAGASWAPADDTEATTLGALLETSALPELPALLGVSTAEAWDLWRGHQQLTADQQTAVAGQFGVDTSRLLGGPSPAPALVAELDHPRWRGPLRDLQSAGDLDETAARMTAARGAMALAARQTGSGDGGWRARLQHYFENSVGDR